jgi:hypothetical protein
MITGITKHFMFHIYYYYYYYYYYYKPLILDCVMVIVLAVGSNVRGFTPDRGQWIFKGNKNQ